MPGERGSFLCRSVETVDEWMWLFNGGPELPDGVSTGMLPDNRTLLMISNVTESHRGDFICQGRIGDDTISAQVLVSVGK